MFGVRSPLIAPPKLVLTVVKLPITTPPNPCTDARGSCADAAELTSRMAIRIAAHEVIRIVYSSNAGASDPGKSRTRVNWRLSSKKIADRLAHVPLRRQ